MCRPDQYRSAAQQSGSELPMWTGVKWQTVKELAPSSDRTERPWNCTDLQLQRSRSERQHQRHNGTSDVGTEPDGVLPISR